MVPAPDRIVEVHRSMHVRVKLGDGRSMYLLSYDPTQLELSDQELVGLDVRGAYQLTHQKTLALKR